MCGVVVVVGAAKIFVCVHAVVNHSLRLLSTLTWRSIVADVPSERAARMAGFGM